MEMDPGVVPFTLELQKQKQVLASKVTLTTLFPVSKTELSTLDNFLTPITQVPLDEDEDEAINLALTGLKATLTDCVCRNTPNRHQSKP